MPSQWAGWARRMLSAIFFFRCPPSLHRRRLLARLNSSSGALVRSQEILGQVDEAIGATEVDEDAEVADAETALATRSPQLGEQAVLLLERHSCSAPRSERMTRLRRRLSSMTFRRRPLPTI